MKNSGDAILQVCCVLLSIGTMSMQTLADTSKTAKELPVPGELFMVEGHTAFLIMPQKPQSGVPTPWVWYAPTLPGLPSSLETWLFERLLEQGIAIAGIDVGESYGSPAGRTLYSALYRELVAYRGLSQRPCLLARSRGGLMLYNWAVEHPDAVACIAGIYPVCDLRFYPGLAKACGAYGLTENELAAELVKHNPIDRLAPLAEAGVPVLHLHGDQDDSVHVEKHSGELAKRYEALGGTVTLRVMEGQGHTDWDGYFQSQELLDFLITHADENRAAGFDTQTDNTK